MAPTHRPRHTRIPKDKFSLYFNHLKSQPYNESPAGRPPGPLYSIRSIAWNPVGSLVATGSSDKTLRVWNPEKPNVRFSTELKGHLAGIEKIAFNPVKDAELCSVSNDGVVKFWDVRTKTCVNEVKSLGNAHSLAWAPDGSSVLVGNRRGEVFQISPTKPAALSSRQLPVDINQMAFCWSGEKVFLPTTEGTIRILSYPELEPILHVNHAVKEGESTEFVLKGHTASCLTTELSPTGRYLATGGADSIIALFDTKDWICQRTVSRMVGPVKSISFTFDGSYVVGGCEEGSGLEVTHTETGDHVHTFKTAGPCEAVAWAPTRYCLAYSDLGVLRIVDVDRK
ncbi:WD40-repeat-containing domain protein [Staphylotrichum tortipilum]|uniref:WD40-repeat-containing domain protein n=1 Tax=Staphylotrichum tortipilum TaxID=2831512 RepID=A0AAN6MSM4_9PEZI|nr:WD40-repeat-containing domain protein [Staphylotrichum longicolle]